MGRRLRCSMITKRYGGFIALSELSLKFPTTGIVGIVGPNGAGKSTLLNTITGFSTPDSGRCFLGEEDITGLTPDRIARKGITRTFQELKLMRRCSVLENLLLGFPLQRGENLFYALSGMNRKEERRISAKALHLLATVGLQDRTEMSTNQLSFGQQKVLSVLQAYASAPDILLLDEPFAGVDSENRGRIISVLETASAEGRLVVFIEHDVALVKAACEHVIVMASGEVMAEGSPLEVFDRQDVVEAYLV